MLCVWGGGGRACTLTWSVVSSVLGRAVNPAARSASSRARAASASSCSFRCRLPRAPSSSARPRTAPRAAFPRRPKPRVAPVISLCQYALQGCHTRRYAVSFRAGSLPGHLEHTSTWSADCSRFPRFASLRSLARREVTGTGSLRPV